MGGGEGGVRDAWGWDVKRTRCLSYGEPKDCGAIYFTGGVVDVCRFDALCGRVHEDDDPPLSFSLPEPYVSRRKGTCRACYQVWRAVVAASWGEG